MPQQIKSEGTPWCKCREFRRFPFLHRLWLSWCAHGIKRKTGGTLGGNWLFSLVKRYFQWRPYHDNNFIIIPVWNGGYVALLDLLDFQTFQHTVPVLAKNGAERRVLEMLLRPGETFIDVGANQGVFTLMAAKIAGPSGAVYSYEPNPRLYQALQLSREVNDFQWIDVRGVALSDREGKAEFYVPDRSSGVGSLIRSHAELSSASRCVHVPLTTLDSDIEKFKPSVIKLIKIDVEGNEFKVIKGAGNTLSHYKPFLWFEMNPPAQEKAGVDQLAIFTMLKEYGYGSFYDIDMVGTRHQGIVEEVGVVEKLTNILAIPVARMDLFRSLKSEWYS